jgi:hypothetical protein
MLQSNQVLSFFRFRENGSDWSQQELAEFYRVEDALVKSGVTISTDRGVTDEGEPWFVFYRQDNDEVIVHFARIDGQYVVVSNLTDGIVRGRNFQALIRELLESHPYVLPKTNSRRQTVYLHPATLLAALVVTGYFKSAEMNSGPEDAGRSEKGFGAFFNKHDFLALSAILIATVWDNLTADPDFHKFAGLGWLDDAKPDSYLAASSNTGHDREDLLLNLGVDGPGHAHDALHPVLGLEQQTASAGVGGTLTAQVNYLGYQGLSNHSNDADFRSSSHADRDGDVKSASWHPDADSSDGQDQVAVASKPGIFAAQLAPSAQPDLHGSSSPPPAAQSSSSPDATTAFSVVSDLLHINPQALHPIVLAASNLSDAVQTTLLQFGPESTDPLSTSVSATTSLPAGDHPPSSAELLATAPIQSFNAAAAHSLQLFFQETPTYQIESFGPDLLVVDTNLSHYASNKFGIETWLMPDGTTLSILGLAAHHPAALAA